MIIDLAFNTANKSSSNFIASLWILAKYSSSLQLAKFIRSHANIWKFSSFISRQVAAAIPRFRHLTSYYVFVEKTIYESGQLEALRVLSHLNELKESQPLSKPDKLYVMHGSNDYEVYPLQKFLIIYDLLTCDSVDRAYRLSLRSDMLSKINDPLYAKEIKEIVI